jgi:hypothetical protein
MVDMRLWVVVLAFVACKSAPSGPASEPTATAPPGTSTSADDPWAGASGSGTTGAGTADAGSATPDAHPAPGSTVTIYERGTFTTMPTSKATERDGCIGTPADLTACKQLQPGASCDLAPWYRAADVYCSGTPVPPTPPQPAEACGCTCSAEYVRAYGEWSQRAQACKNVP